MTEKSLFRCLLFGLSATACALCVSYWWNRPMYLPDESDIVGLAYLHIKGNPYPIYKYPNFPYFFYEFFFRIWILVAEPTDTEYPITVARFVNTAIYTVNIVLFYITARYYLDRRWSLFASILFAFSPVVFLSGVFVKTESLLLAELFVVLISVHELLIKPELKRWHVIAAVACGLGVSTKYNIALVSIYLSGLVIVYVFNREGRLLNRLISLFRSSNGWIFIGVFVVTVLISWPDIWRYPPPSDVLKDDLYFCSLPTYWRCVDEPFAFPYGRYSYTFLHSIPFAVGIFNYAFFWLALVFRAIPARVLGLWGVFTAVFLIVPIHATLTRTPWTFTCCVPLFSIAGALFFNSLLNKWKGPAAKVVVYTFACFAILVSATQYTTFVDWYYARLLIPKAANDSKENSTDRVYAFLHCLSPRTYSVNGDFAKSVEQGKPKYILVLDAYLYNICKYKENPVYNLQCEYLKKLISEKEGYKILWTKSIDIPFKELFFDPEVSMTYYFLKRQADHH